jgi:hypothetical protein
VLSVKIFRRTRVDGLVGAAQYNTQRAAGNVAKTSKHKLECSSGVDKAVESVLPRFEVLWCLTKCFAVVRV